jgi:glycosyltransferase involved in cell wall biosynthesis
VRVIQVAPTPFGPGGLLGGGERYPLELGRALAKNVDCQVLSFGRREIDVRDTSGLRLRTLRALAYRHGHPAHPLAPGLLRALAGADIVHTHHMRSTPSRLSALRARVFRQWAVVTDHGLQGSDWRGLVPRLFHRFLTVSAFSAKELGSPPERTHVIYGGADPGRFSPDASVSRRGILFVGRITPHKGIDCLIEALPDGSELLVAGSAGHDPTPPERDYPSLLRQLARDRQVSFLGPVAEDGLPALYRQAAVLALPSVTHTCYGRHVRVSELLGLAVIEAMASGTPAVCSRLGGLAEVVQDGLTGFLVEPGNVAELRERLTEVLSQPALAARMGRNARALALERFTWDACAERCLSVYTDLLSSRAG